MKEVLKRKDYDDKCDNMCHLISLNVESANCQENNKDEYLHRILWLDVLLKQSPYWVDLTTLLIPHAAVTNNTANSYRASN